MKIVYLYAGLPEYRKDFFSSLDKKLKEKGHDFCLIYMSREDVSLQVSDVDFASIPCLRGNISFGLFSFQYFKNFISVFKKTKPDVVILQFHIAILSYWWMFLYSKTHRLPYITWDCNWTRDTLKSWLVRLRTSIVDFTYMKATTCLTYGTVFRDYLVSIGKPKEDVFVAQNTINVEKILTQRSVSCSNRDFNHSLHFLYVGALIQRKFVLPAVEAFAELMDEGFDIFFDIVGKGPEQEKIYKFIKEKKVDNRIKLHGALHGVEVKSFFENCDVFIMPGTGGLAVNEAMAYSLPIISTKGDDTIVDLIDGNGFLLDNYGDKEEIKQAIRRFIELDITEKKAMAKRSETLLKKVATMSNMVNQHIAAIERAIEKKYIASNEN